MRGLLFFGFLYFVLSCEQNPLRDIPSTILDGTYTTGEHHLSRFQDSLHKKMVKVDVLSHTAPVMVFKEGQIQSYDVQIRLLHNLGSKYTVKVIPKISSHLNDSMKVTSDFKGENKVILNLKWMPDKTFTGPQSYKTFSLPLMLQFKDRQTEKKVFSIKRKIDIMVYRVLDKPEIYKIKTDYDEYEKLDDGYFYKRYGAKKLNLNYHDQVFVGENKKKKISSHLNFYSKIIYERLNSQVLKYPNFSSQHVVYSPSQWETESGFDKLLIYDQDKNLVSDEILNFIKQPLYHIAGDVNHQCDEDMTVSIDKDGKRCLISLDIKNSVDFNEDIYIKQYQIPGKVDSEHLFYKMESQHLCEIYHYISFAHLFKKEKWKKRDSCYLSAKRYGIRNKVKEKEDIYLLKKVDTLELVDKSGWKFNFYKIKKSIQWQMGGHRPILDDENIRIHLVRNDKKKGEKKGELQDDPDAVVKDVNKIKFYVKDYNYFDEPPMLAPVQKEDADFLYWYKHSSIDMHWEFGGAKEIQKGEWELSYKVTVNGLKGEDKKDFNFQMARIKLFPSSLINHIATRGKEVNVNMTVLPLIVAQHFEHFDPKKDIIFSMDVKYEDGLKKWLSSTFSLSGAIRTRYTFPSGFLIHIQKLASFYEIPFFHFKSTKKISDYLKFGKLRPRSNYTCSKQGTKPRQVSILTLKDHRCNCSEWIGYEWGNYVENTCAYKITLQLNPDKLKDSSGQLIPFYWYYDFFLKSEPISLTNQFYKNSSIKDVPMSIKTEPFVFQNNTPTKISDIRTRFHIFSNLQPTLNCESESNPSDKKCKIIYSFNVDWHNDYYNSFLANKDFFSKEIGVWPQLLCSEESNTKGSYLPAGDCPCDKKPVFSNNGIEFNCVFKNDQKRRSISAQLKTNNPYIYFLNTDVQHNEKPQSYKRTPLVVLKMH